MKRKIALYIDGRRADLNDEALVLLNYAVTDLQKPTAVRNTYSHQVKLPGTPTNDAIFSHIFRTDKEVTVLGFNPLVRTPFKIFDDAGELLQAGYLKLESIERASSLHTYAVALYGTLGSLMYDLTYDSEGEKLSLADLEYLADDDNFYFNVNKGSIADAWAKLYNGVGADLWDIINFAPCYNGLPNSISADKARMAADYSKIATLPRKFTEWEIRDLRCQLQRPAIRVKKVLDAIVAKAAALGTTITLDSAFFKSGNAYYDKTWMLLPMLTDYNDEQAGQVGSASEELPTGTGVVQAEVPTGVAVVLDGSTFASDSNGVIDFSTFDPSCFLQGMLTGYLGSGDPFGNLYLSYWDGSAWIGTVVGVQVVITDQNTSQVLAKSALFVYGNYTTGDGKITTLLSAFGEATCQNVGINQFSLSRMPDFTANFNNVAVSASDKVRIALNIMAVSDTAQMGDTDFDLYEDEDGSTSFQCELYIYPSDAGRLALYKPGTIGTGTTVTKSMLLSNTATPADFLLSYCRQFNLRVLETSPGEISILSLNTFYNGTTTDITKKADISNTSLVPVVFTKKWQQLALTIPQSQKAIDYKNTYGRNFGDIRLDTGYDFNKEAEELLDKSIFKGGVYGKDLSPLFYDYYKAGNYVNPVVAMYGYTLGDQEVQPDWDERTPINSEHFGYDLTGKVYGFSIDKQEQKAVDISGTLVFLAGVMRNPGRWYITQDYSSEDVCWQIPAGADAYSTLVVNLPVFSRYMESGGAVTLSLDFGTPAEIYDPGLTISPVSSIYTRFWEKFCIDVFDKSNKVLKTKVLLTGMQVGPGLLRRLFFFDGSLWVLNKISNYSLTTWDPAECEFIQVRKPSNYTNGQTL